MKSRTGEAPGARGWHAGLATYAWAVALAWTLASAGSFSWGVWQEQGHTTETAAAAATMALERDLLYRAWAASKGGVYVRQSAAAPPNPFLEGQPDRDLTSTTGIRLTLVNTAYMTRQVHELNKGRSEIRGHLSSLRPLNPANQPDAWERAGLLSFRQGAKESRAFAKLDDREYFRMQRPFFVEPACLTCHAAQGYKEGDLRGGISIAVPLAPFRAVERARVTHMAAWHGAVWFLGLLATWGSWRNVSREARAREAADARREALVGELQVALGQVRILSGLIPICAWCKKMRDDSGYWQQVETYLRSCSEAEFTHGICEDCARKFEGTAESQGSPPSP